MAQPVRREAAVRELLPEREHLDHLRFGEGRPVVLGEEPPAVRARPHVHLFVDEEAGAGEAEAEAVVLAVTIGVDGEGLELIEPLGPGRGRLLRVEARVAVEVLAVDDEVGAELVGDAVAVAVGVAVELHHRVVEIVHADGVENLVDREEEPLGRERTLHVGLAMRGVGRGARREGGLELRVERTRGDRLLLDLDAGVHSFVLGDDLVHDRDRAGVRLGVPESDHLVLRQGRGGYRHSRREHEGGGQRVQHSPHFRFSFSDGYGLRPRGARSRCRATMPTLESEPPSVTRTAPRGTPNGPGDSSWRQGTSGSTSLASMRGGSPVPAGGRRPPQAASSGRPRPARKRMTAEKSRSAMPVRSIMP